MDYNTRWKYLDCSSEHDLTVFTTSLYLWCLSDHDFTVFTCSRYLCCSVNMIVCTYKFNLPMQFQQSWFHRINMFKVHFLFEWSWFDCMFKFNLPMQFEQTWAKCIYMTVFKVHFPFEWACFDCMYKFKVPICCLSDHDLTVCTSSSYLSVAIMILLYLQVPTVFLAIGNKQTIVKSRKKENSLTLCW